MQEGQKTDASTYEVDQLPGSEWEDLANCREADNDLFFPAGDSEYFQPQIEAAKAICNLCVVKDECLEFAVATNQDSGIWGGMDEKERRKYRKRWLSDKRRTHIRE